MTSDSVLRDVIRDFERLPAQVVAEAKRIAEIRGRVSLRPGWLDAALRAAGVVGPGESL